MCALECVERGKDTEMGPLTKVRRGHQKREKERQKEKESEQRERSQEQEQELKRECKVIE